MSYLLTEAGDVLLTETGDRILLDEVVGAALAGTATIRLTATANLAAAIGLAGTATIRLTSTAALSVVPVGSALSGTATIRLTTQGLLTSEPARLAGRATIVLRAAAALVNEPAIPPLREADIQRPVGHVDQTAPTATPLPGLLRFTLESSLDTPADGWTAEVAGAALLIAPDDDALYRLSAGFYDAANTEVVATQIASGRILDRRLVGRATERRTYLRGVDALQRTFLLQRKLRYVPTGSERIEFTSERAVLQDARSVAQVELQSVWSAPEWPTPGLEDRAELLEAELNRLDSSLQYVTEQAVVEKPGNWLASTVAADLAAGSGMTVLWGVRDYRLHVPFEASGSVYDLIRELAEPWNQVPGLGGVDVTALGTVIHVRPRLLHPPAGLTLTVAASRLVELDLLRGERLPPIGTVELEGRIEPAGEPGEPGVIPPIGFVTSSEQDVPYTNEQGGGGWVEGVRTYRMPDRILIRLTERVFSVQPDGRIVQSKEETTTYTYEDSHYGANGIPTRQPLPLSLEKSISLLRERKNPDGTTELVLGESVRETTTWKYNHSRLLEVTTTERQERYDQRMEDGTTFTHFPTVALITETRSYKANGWLEMRTSRTVFDPKTGQTRNSLSDQAQDAAGFAPGGSRPPFGFDFAIYGTVPQAGEAVPVRLRVTLSNDPTAIAVRYSNPNLTRHDLEYILDQMRAASGLVPYTLQGRGPALPDVMKGTTMLLTEYVDADGTPIPLDPALVRSISFSYQDTRESAAFECAFEAVFYRDA